MQIYVQVFLSSQKIPIHVIVIYVYEIRIVYTDNNFCTMTRVPKKKKKGNNYVKEFIQKIVYTMDRKKKCLQIPLFSKFLLGKLFLP